VDRNAGHPHRGAVPPYTPGPFKTLSLSKADLKELANGKAVMKQIPAEGGSGLGGRAICVQDVEAPKKAVWNQILDLNSYKGKVSKLKECKNYDITKNRDGSTTIKTKMVIGVVPGYSVRWYIIDIDMVLIVGSLHERHSTVPIISIYLLEQSVRKEYTFVDRPDSWAEHPNDSFFQIRASNALTTPPPSLSFLSSLSILSYSFILDIYIYLLHPT
jgi:hypothetical protein